MKFVIVLGSQNVTLIETKFIVKVTYEFKMAIESFGFLIPLWFVLFDSEARSSDHQYI